MYFAALSATVDLVYNPLQYILGFYLPENFISVANFITPFLNIIYEIIQQHRFEMIPLFVLAVSQ